MKPHTGGESISTMCNSCRPMSKTFYDMIEKTALTGRETAIAWCTGYNKEDSDTPIDQPTHPYESDEITDIPNISKMELGSKGSVISPDINCRTFESLSHFHTHPGGDKRFSAQDYSLAFRLEREIVCLGVKDKSGKNIVHCDILRPSHERHEYYRTKISDINNTVCNPAQDRLVYAIDNNSPAEEVSAAYEQYNNGYNDILHLINKALYDGVIKRCSIASNITGELTKPIPDIPDRLIRIERRYDSYDSSCLDYVDKSTNKKIGFISYSVWDEWKEDKDGNDYIEKEGKIHDVEFDMEYPAEDILYSSIEKIMCDLKCKGVEKRVYIDDPQYAEIFEDILEFERSSKDSNTIEKDISDLECECVTGAESVTGIV